MARIHRIVRIVWPLAGLIFTGWLWLSFQARGLPAGVMTSDAGIAVTESDTEIRFAPSAGRRATGLLFYPGGMVEPTAYAPLARALAEQGWLTVIVKLPWGTAPLRRHEARLWQTTHELVAAEAGIARWVLAGHSRGAAIAARMAHRHEDAVDGLVLIATTHPKASETSLRDARLPIIKIFGSEDGLASPREIESFRRYLPEHTVFVAIDGGNHAQFGYYGTQLGDHAAKISRAEQQAATIEAMRGFLERVGEPDA